MAPTTPSHLPTADHPDEHGLAHVIPVRVLVGVFLALVLLTVVTVAVPTRLDFEPTRRDRLIFVFFVVHLAIRAG